MSSSAKIFLRALLAASLVGLVCFVQGAAGAASVKLRVAFKPDIAGSRTTLEMKVRIGGGPGGAPPPSPVTKLNLRMPANMGIGTTTLGEINCDPASLMQRGLTGCSTNSRIGFGDATAVVPVGSQYVAEKVALHTLMGPPVRDRIEVLFYLEGRSPVLNRAVFPGEFLEDSGLFGEQLDTSITPIQAWPEGPDMALETFNSTIGPLDLTYYRRVKGRTVSFHPQGVRLPQSCPRGGYPFAAELSFADGSTAEARYTVRCPPPR